ncbi:PspC domain-containing protein [Undibacterium cyanobacteriorum]|uniref:PspC domain-containing protein n=1 Tax=Undibacterium cyanobacteriorum TaxID=3073561 RepID=A0ABY9RCJ0_9BURK|nr:PspC domain-containing protein [Undibacterium sp. 20NA77.5]WMW78947.1 PspC domain-containing protein [Undibacterium sp. 20NA77.5]
MNIADEIARLHELHRSGALSDEEFAAAKEKVLASASTSSQASGNENPFSNLNQLRRSKHNQWVGGVCAGLGKYSNLEPWIWRLMFVLFVSAFGTGFIAYLLAWVFIPEEE